MGEILTLLLDIIKSRRSIREYLSGKISKDILFRILEAARWAPSAHNAQPWRFIIIRKRGLKEELARAMADEWIKDMIKNGLPSETQKDLVETSIRRFTKAPVLIIACVTMEDMDKYPDLRRQEYEHIMAVQSLAAAIQNMLLMAHSEGLGACWFCAPLFCQEVVRKVLKIPDDVEPVALITLGYPSERASPPFRKPVEEIAYKNYWGERL